jgi:hypothetical protein
MELLPEVEEPAVLSDAAPPLDCGNLLSTLLFAFGEEWLLSTELAVSNSYV